MFRNSTARAHSQIRWKWEIPSKNPTNFGENMPLWSAPKPGEKVPASSRWEPGVEHDQVKTISGSSTVQRIPASAGGPKQSWQDAVSSSPDFFQTIVGHPTVPHSWWPAWVTSWVDTLTVVGWCSSPWRILVMLDPPRKWWRTTQTTRYVAPCIPNFAGQNPICCWKIPHSWAANFNSWLVSHSWRVQVIFWRSVWGTCSCYLLHFGTRKCHLRCFGHENR